MQLGNKGNSGRAVQLGRPADMGGPSRSPNPDRSRASARLLASHERLETDNATVHAAEHAYTYVAIYDAIQPDLCEW